MLKLTKHLILCLILILFIPHESLSKTCCKRDVGTEILFPYDVNSKIYNDLLGSGSSTTAPEWDNVFTSTLRGGGCPLTDMLEIQPINPPPFPAKLDYKFSGKYSVVGDDTPPRGYGVTLSVNLIDIAHGATVKNSQTRWTCEPKEAGDCLPLTMQNNQNLAKTFQPLDKLIYDYERIPETLDIELEKDPILAGDEMTITLKNIKDANSKPSQPWQRILVKVEKGRILNGITLMEYKVFEVGSGNIQLQYQAPEACRHDNEKITIMNSCVIDPKINPIPEQEIVTKKFDIFCVEGRIEITEDIPESSSFQNIMSSMLIPKCGYSGGTVTKTPGQISFRPKPTKDPCYYEVVQKDTKPSEHQFRYTPSPANYKKCCDWQFIDQMTYKFVNTPYKASLDFKKDPNKPFYFSIESERNFSSRCLQAPQSAIKEEHGKWHPQHNNNWPMTNGYRETFGTSTYLLYIDEKEVNKLRDNCLKRKK